MNDRQAEIYALAKRKGILLRHDFVDHNFPKQAALIKDRSRRRWAKCTRRAGKSVAVQRILLQHGYERPNSLGLYLALTRQSARNIMWPIVKQLNKSFDLQMDLSDHMLTAKLQNGSEIIYSGVDAFDDSMARHLGTALNSVVIDECASYRVPMYTLVDDVLDPTTIDYDAPIVAVGSPGLVKAGWFYDLTTGKIPGWSGHSWSTYDNPYMAKKFAARIAEMRAIDPNIESKPSFRRQYLGEWVDDDENVIYPYDHALNYAEELPDGIAWTFGVGIDLGWNDDTAFVVAAWSSDHPHMYLVDAFKKPEMTFDDVDRKLKELNAKYKLERIVIDNANKQGVEDMRRRFGWHFIPAEKTAKLDKIGLMVNDLMAGRVKVLPGAEDVVSEWAGLMYEADKSPAREDPRCPNHLSDAALYIFGHGRHYAYQQPETKPETNSPEYFKQQEQDMLDKSVDRYINQTSRRFM